MLKLNMEKEITLPDLKSAIYTENYPLRITPEMKQKLVELKLKYRKDVADWLRQLISRELEKELLKLPHP